MKRSYITPFLSAILGAGVVVAILAAVGDLGGSTTTYTTVQSSSSAPAAPSNASVTSSGGGLTPHQVYVKDAPGVAFVTSTIVQKSESPFNIFGGEVQRQGTATASGILIDRNGTILTNYHVVENAVRVTVSFGKGSAVEAKVAGTDPSHDLAVLRIHPDGLSLHPVPLGNSDAVQVGDPVYAIGNPFNLERTLTTGVISALQREIQAPNGFAIRNVLQTDAPINPGNSGGPLLNTAGQAIGINSQIETSGGSNGNIGIGFAVPINLAKSEIGQLEQGGTLRGAYLGVVSRTVDGSLASLNLPVTSGALVLKVENGTPAEAAGIRGGNSSNGEGNEAGVGGDVIVAFNGKKVTSAEDLSADIEAQKPGDTVTIELWYPTGKGSWKKRTVHAKLGSRPSQAPATAETPEG